MLPPMFQASCRTPVSTWKAGGTVVQCSFLHNAAVNKSKTQLNHRSIHEHEFLVWCGHCGINRKKYIESSSTYFVLSKHRIGSVAFGLPGWHNAESWRQHWQPHTIQQVFETFANYLKCPEKLSEFVLEPIHSGWNPLELAALKALSQGSRIWPSSAQKRVKVEIAKQAKLQAHGDMPLASCHATFVGGRYHQMSLCCQCSGAFHLAGQSL